LRWVILRIVGVRVLLRVGAGRGIVGERFVRAVDPLLKFWMRFLATGREAFKPKKKSMPVDAYDDLKRQERVFEGKEQEVPISEGNAFSSQNTDELTVLSTVIINEDLKAITGEMEAKIKLEIEIGEWRNIEVLHHATLKSPIFVEGN